MKTKYVELLNLILNGKIGEYQTFSFIKFTIIENGIVIKHPNGVIRCNRRVIKEGEKVILHIRGINKFHEFTNTDLAPDDRIDTFLDSLGIELWFKRTIVDQSFNDRGKRTPIRNEDVTKFTKEQMDRISERCNRRTFDDIFPLIKSKITIADLEEVSMNPAGDKLIIGSMLTSTYRALTSKSEPKEVECLFSNKSMLNRLLGVDIETVKIFLDNTGHIDQDKLNAILDILHDYFYQSPEFKEMVDHVAEKYGIRIDLVKKGEL